MTSTAQLRPANLRTRQRSLGSLMALAIMLMPGLLATSSAQGRTLTVLHTFEGGADGSFPSAGVVRDATGNFYGTTLSGGAFNSGSVFKVDATGKETVLYSFTGGADGSFPAAGVTLDAAGNLYGTTDVGGTSNNGTVFKLDNTGKETVLYSFAGAPDGATPTTRVIRDPAGNIYGATISGGAFDNGTVFKLDRAGEETILHSFTGGADGGGPGGGVIRDAAGNIYGTTVNGGDPPCNNGIGCGTVFKLDTTGKETVLYTFTGKADGAFPTGTLTRDTAGNIYGTTQGGGDFNNGTVYKLDHTGNETVLYSFTAGPQILPVGGVIRDGAGNLYGTTELGGAFEAGTVFKLNNAGKETVLHSFTGKADGANPFAGVVRDAAGNLYGTATNGGDPTCLCGTVFKIAP